MSNIDQSGPLNYASMAVIMKITCRTVEGVTILDVQGRIALGDDVAVLKQSISELIIGDPKYVLLNLQDVPYIDSSGIGELVSALTKVRGSGGELKLVNLTKKVRAVLEITRLYTVFDVSGDEATAILSFPASAPA